MLENLSLNNVSIVLISISCMILGGVILSTLLKKLSLPAVTGYIIAGIILGPSCLKLVSSQVIENMEFLNDIALSFIAFSVGSYFKKDMLNKNINKTIIITIFEALTAAIAIFITMYYIFNFSLAFSLILAAISSSTAPASTLMTIKQTKAKGEYVNTLLQVVAFDDVISLLAFSLAIAISEGLETSNVSVQAFLMPIVYNLLSILIGFILGFILSKLIKKENKELGIIIVLLLIFINASISSIINVSPLLSCMVLGMVYKNIGTYDDLFTDISKFSDPILLLFFVYNGAKLNISSLLVLGLPGLIYFIVRIIGKYIGASAGSYLTKSDASCKKYLGLGLIPQAGVSIGLASLGARNLSPELGNMLLTIILSSSILYELIGPIASKCGLYLSKSYVTTKNVKTINNQPNITFEDNDEFIIQSNSLRCKVLHRNNKN